MRVSVNGSVQKVCYSFLQGAKVPFWKERICERDELCESSYEILSFIGVPSQYGDLTVVEISLI